MIDLPPPSYEQTIEAVVKCAVPRANVHISYENEMQSDVVTISDVGQLTDEKLRCLRSAVHPFYILTLEKPAQQAAFYALAAQDNRPREKAEALEWLRVQGRLAQLPIFDPSQKLERFASALEAACGLTAGQALLVRDASTIIVKPKLFQRFNFREAGSKLECLTRMYAASDAYDHNVRLFFIGNEAARESDKD